MIVSLPTNTPELMVKLLDTTGVEPVYVTVRSAAVSVIDAGAITVEAELDEVAEPAVLLAVTRAFRYFPISADTKVYEDAVALEISE